MNENQINNLSDTAINIAIAEYLGYKVHDTGRGIHRQVLPSAKERSPISRVLTDYSDHIGNVTSAIRHLISQTDGHGKFTLEFCGSYCVAEYRDDRFDYRVVSRTRKPEHRNYIARAIAELAFRVIKEISTSEIEQLKYTGKVR